jgi:hypothetical protein
MPLWSRWHETVTLEKEVKRALFWALLGAAGASAVWSWALSAMCH